MSNLAKEMMGIDPEHKHPQDRLMGAAALTLALGLAYAYKDEIIGGVSDFVSNVKTVADAVIQTRGGRLDKIDG